MRHSTQLFFIVALLLLLPSIALATHDIDVIVTSQSNEFLFSAPTQSVSVCQCASAMSSLSITNAGSFTTRYDVAVNKAYVTLGQTVVQLQPGETTTIPVYITAPCDAKGTETLQTVVTSMYGESKLIEQELMFANCPNTQVVFSNASLTADICEPFTTSFTLTNTGTFIEEYTVFVDSFTQYATLNANAVVLQPDQSIAISTHYALPCDVYGTHSLDYTVLAKNNNHVASFSKEVFINQSYLFSVDAAVPEKLCEKEGASFSVFLRNQNDFADTYKLDLSGPSFMSMEIVNPQDGESLKEITLQPNQAKEFVVYILPEGKKTFGAHEFTVAATSLNGDVTRLFSSSFLVQDCYNFVDHIDIPYSDIHLCGKDTVQRPFELKNTGEVDVFVELVLTAPDFVTLDAYEVLLDSSSQESLYLEFTDVPEIAERYPITLTSYFRGEVVDEASFMLHTLPAESCYQITPNKQAVSLRYTKDAFTLAVENEGTRYGWYEFSVSSPLLIIDSAIVDMGASEQKELTFLLDKEALFMTLAAQNTSLIGYTLNTTIDVLHLDSGVSFNYPLTITFTDYPWTTYAWNTIKNQSACVLSFFVLSFFTVIFLVLLIVFLCTKRMFRPRTGMGFILLLVMILATLIVFIAWGVPSYSDYYTVYDLETNSTTYLRLAEDKARTFDLTDFFFDPDGDIVEYGVTSISEEVLSYKITNSQLRLSPATDWSGGTILQLYAVDSYGERAQSPDIFVEVLPVEDYSLREFFLLTCVYINLLVLLLLSILLYVVSSLRNRKKELARQHELEQKEKDRLKREREAKRLANKKAREAKKKAKEQQEKSSSPKV